MAKTPKTQKRIAISKLIVATLTMLAAMSLLGLAWGFTPVRELLPTVLPQAIKSYIPVILNTRTFEQELIDLINAERTKNGLIALTPQPLLFQVAEAHSMDMATNDYLAHAGLSGDHAGERLTKAGYAFSYWGEVIAGGSASPEIAFEGWMNSPPHKTVLLNPAYTEIGAGYVLKEGTVYWHYWCVVVAIPKGVK